MSLLKSAAGQAARLDRGYAYSFITQLTAAVKKLKGAPVWVCWEGGKGGRENLLPAYKADRTESHPTIRSDRESVQALLTTLGVDQFVAPGYEADDVIASLSNRLMSKVIIWSGDKDFLQLIDDRVSVYQKVRVNKVKNERMVITDENFNKCVGWASPKLWFEGQLAIGDAVDGIPGLEQVGPATVHAYHCGVKIPDAKRRRLDAFYDGSEQLKLNRRLMDLRSVGPLPIQITPGELSMASSLSLLQELGFASIVGRYPEWFHVYEKACKEGTS